jgi:hypothetical protein
MALPILTRACQSSLCKDSVEELSYPRQKKILTFRSLQFLVLSWYFCRLVTALSLSDSNKSFSLALLGHGGAFVVVCILWYLISSGSTALAPNNNRNGLKLVALQTSVVTPYCPWHDHHPFALLLTFEYFLYCLKNQGVSSLNCSIGLRMIYRCEEDLHPDLMTEILEHGTIKILGIIDGDLLRNSIATEDVLPEKFLDGGEIYIGYWFCFNPFGEVLDCDNGKAIVSL